MLSCKPGDDGWVARGFAARSMEQAEDPIINRGKAQRALGQALLVSGQVEPALAALKQSLGLLQDQDPYETARTQAVCGQIFVDRGEELLQQAQSEFEKLGVAIVEQTSSIG